MSSRALLAIAALAAVAGLAAPARAAPPRQYAVAPPPSWVEPVAADRAPRPGAEGVDGQDFLLVDDQVRVPPSGPAVEHFRHEVRRILSAKGVETGSELEVDFDPLSQRLTLHGVWIERGGRRRAALPEAEVQVLQREEEADRRLYDGRLTALVILRDVRAGDLVEFAYTVTGDNPVMGGRWSGGFSFGYGAPIGRRVVRLLWPAGRPLATRANRFEVQPQVTRRGEVELRRWDLRDVPAVTDEGDTPPGVDPWPWVALSEWRDWGEVVAWGLPMYSPPPPTPAMEEHLAGWRALPTPEARALAALRFVQEEVRYLGMELGTGSHRPRLPGEVLEKRFGDCKDKSLLLVTLLRALDVEAWPALVATDLRGAVADVLPGPGAFDHVIVLARVDGAERWLDPTRSLERAPLAARQPPPWGRALVLAPGEAALRTIPAPGPAALETTATWRVERFGEPMRLEVVTRHEGERAIGMRHDLASRPLKEIEKHYLDFYAHQYKDIRVAAPLRVEDDPGQDRLVTHEAYLLPGVEAGGRLHLESASLDALLKLPATVRRDLPLRIAHPERLHERIRVELPGRPDIVDADEVVKGPASTLTYSVRTEGKATTIDLRYETTRDALPPGEVARHVEALEEMRRRVALSMPLAVARMGPAKASPAGEQTGWSGRVPWFLVLLAMFSAGLMAAGALRRWRAGGAAPEAERAGVRRSAFAAAQAPDEPGESPSAPAVVSGPEQAAALAARAPCGCGAPLRGLVPRLDTVRLAGRTVGVVRLDCERCGAGRWRYYVLG